MWYHRLAQVLVWRWRFQNLTFTTFPVFDCARTHFFLFLTGQGWHIKRKEVRRRTWYQSRFGTRSTRMTNQREAVTCQIIIVFFIVFRPWSWFSSLAPFAYSRTHSFDQEVRSKRAGSPATVHTKTGRGRAIPNLTCLNPPRQCVPLPQADSSFFFFFEQCDIVVKPCVVYTLWNGYIR